MSRKILEFLRLPTLLLFQRAVRLARGKKLGTRFPFLWTGYRFFLARIAKGIIVREVEGHKIYMDLGGKGPDLQLYLCGSYDDEKFEVDLFKKAVKKDMVVIDVGAHIGYYALTAARQVGPSGKVFAFEPDPHNYELFQKSILSSGYRNITAVNKAVSNRSGSSKLFINPDSSGDRRIFNSADDRNAITIDTVALDDFFKENELKVDILKMDIEGAELAAFQGMSRLIKKSPHMKVFSEFYPEALKTFGYSPKEYLDGWVKLGYKIFYINEKQSRLEPIRSDEACSVVKRDARLAINLLLGKKG
jgi:FkbM family methyltransferase